MLFLFSDFVIRIHRYFISSFTPPIKKWEISKIISGCLTYLALKSLLSAKHQSSFLGNLKIDGNLNIRQKSTMQDITCD